MLCRWIFEWAHLSWRPLDIRLRDPIPWVWEPVPVETRIRIRASHMVSKFQRIGRALVLLIPTVCDKWGLVHISCTIFDVFYSNS